MPKKTIPFPIRIPAPIYQAAARVAEIEHRSINGQLLVWLEKGMPAELLDECRADISAALAGAEK